jgi:uncharacterized membrane protein
MTRKTLAIASVIVVALMAAAAFAVGSAIPADVMLPTHWGIDGRPDDFSDKWSALLMPVALVAGVSLLLYFIPALEPRQGGLQRSQGLYAAGWAGMLLIGGVIELSVIAAALDWPVEADTLILAGIGALFVLIGNQFGKSRSMYMIGIRTPWTLASEEVWIKTHRLAGKLMVAGGVLLILAALLPLAPESVALITGAVVAVAVGVPLIYSFLLWRRERGADQSSG